MFPRGYFPARYFAPTYWPAGFDSGPVTLPLCYSVSMQPCLQFTPATTPAIEFTTSMAPTCEDCE